MANKATDNLLQEDDIDLDAEVMVLVYQINDMDDEEDEVNEINEAASRTTETFDLLQTEDYDPCIILPTHIRLNIFFFLFENSIDVIENCFGVIQVCISYSQSYRKYRHLPHKVWYEVIAKKECFKESHE